MALANMVHNTYKDRMVVEYKELKERYDKLKVMLDKWDKGELGFTPTCPRELLDEQISYMFSYMCILEERAQIEGVELNG